MKPRRAGSGGGERPAADPARLAAAHLRLGWWALLVFLSLGLVLESLHGFKLQWYVSVGTETRRELWRLAHAHGTMLALVNVAFALTVRALGVAPVLAGRCLAAASLLVPVGFFFGGLFARGGDPGLPVVLVPVGALLLAIAVLMTALPVTRRRSGGPAGP